MPIEISWQQPGRVLYQRFYDADISENRTSGQPGFSQQFADAESEALIHVIIDLGGITETPSSLADVRKRILFSDAQNSGHVVIVRGTNPVVRHYALTLSQMVRNETPNTFVDTLDEAMQYLRERDTTVTVE